MSTKIVSLSSLFEEHDAEMKTEYEQSLTDPRAIARLEAAKVRWAKEDAFNAANPAEEEEEEEEEEDEEDEAEAEEEG